MSTPAEFMRLGTTQIITVGAASSAVTNPFGAQTYAIRVASAVGAFVNIGDGTPTATTSNTFVPPNWPEYFAVNPGQRIAAIQAATGGSMSVTELTA